MNCQISEYETKKNKEGIDKKEQRRAAAEKYQQENLVMSSQKKESHQHDKSQELQNDKQFVQTTNDFHQMDLLNKYQKKKQLQAHLANFYQQQHHARIEEENDK